MYRKTAWVTAAATTVAFATPNFREKFKTKEQQSDDLAMKAEKARQVIEQYMVWQGIPGLSVGVSVDGRNVFNEGFGYANVETRTPCTANTVMRIASISKPITATITALLVQEGKLDVSKPITDYLPDFPTKTVDGEKVEITTKQLLSHTSGVRHYSKKKKEGDLEDPTNNSTDAKEYLLNKEFATIAEALELFKDDDLFHKPGTKYSYTTHGFTLVSAVLEKASGKTFTQLLRNFTFRLGLRATLPDINKPLISNRTSYYARNETHRLVNCPEVNNSYKWAGGGILSNCPDLLTFANAILYSFQSNAPDALLKRSVLDEFWNGVTDVDDYTKVGLGWFRVDGHSIGGSYAARSNGGYWYHTGAAIGASSALLIRPRDKPSSAAAPQGICVVILCNLQDTSVLQLATTLENIFYEQ